MVQFHMFKTNYAALFSEIFFFYLFHPRGMEAFVLFNFLRLGVNRTSHYESTTVIKWLTFDLDSTAFYNI